MIAVSDTATSQKWINIAVAGIGLVAMLAAGGILVQHMGHVGRMGPPPGEFETTWIDWVGGLLIVTGMVVVAVATALRIDADPPERRWD